MLRRPLASHSLLLCLPALAGCDAILGSEEETEYAGTLAGQLVQNVNHGNGTTCASTHAVDGSVWIKLTDEDGGVRGSGEVEFTGTPVSIQGDTLYCRLQAVPPLNAYFAGGGVGGDPDHVTWSQTQSESYPDHSSTQSISFDGSVEGQMLSGTLSFVGSGTRTVIDCDTAGCPPPRTVTMNASWTTEIAASEE